jgi:ABC-type branched-subunit amino acid transport system ATPase component
VSKRFGGLVANNEISMTLKAGEIHALIGPNGAGKSTFFNMISGVDDPSSGEVRLVGEAMSGKPSRAFAARGLGRTFQHVRLLGQRSVVENVALGAHLRARRGWLAAACGSTAEEAALMAEARARSNAAASARMPTRRPHRSRWASNAWSKLPAHWPASPRCCCSTSPPPACATWRSAPSRCC